MFLLPLIEVAFIDSLGRVLGFAAPRIFPLLLFVALLPLNALWATPVFSIALALVYFRSRQAVGEDVALGAVVSTRL